MGHMAGVAGFEPTHDGVKVRCLTTWLYPIIDKSGEPIGIRTPDTRLRRPLLYPTELLARGMEQVTGIEPASPAWKAGALAIVLHLHRQLPGGRVAAWPQNIVS